MIRWPVLLACGALLLLASGTSAKEEPTTQTYLVGDLLRKAKAERGPMEELIRVLCTSTSVPHWHGPKATAKIEVLHGDRLAITASPKVHDEIKQVLDALRRLGDVAVRIDSELYNLDRDTFARQIEPELVWDKAVAKENQVYSCITPKGYNLVRKHKAAVRNSKLLGNAEQGRIFSTEKVLLYKARPSWAPVDGEVHETALHGIQFHAHGVISADRRFLTLKLEQRTRDLIEVKPETVTNPLTDKDEEIEVPRFGETRRSATQKIEDGQCLVVVLAGERKGEVRLLLIEPTIHIGEEQKGLKLND